MSTEASACAGFFQDHANTAAINQYFQQLSSQSTAAAASSVNSLSNNNSDSGNDGSITGRTNSTSSGDSTRSSVSSNDSNKSCRNNSAGSGGTGTGGNSLMTAGNGNSNTNQWLAMQQQQQQQQQQNQQHLQQQQQQHHQQQHHNQQQQQHHNQQQQHQQHLNQHQQQQQQHLHHQSMHQTHHNSQQQQQQLQQQQQQQHQQQLQQQQQQQQQQQHQQLSAALSQSLQQNLAAASASAAAAAAAASVTTNPHSIFGSGNFHYKTNNSWSIPSLSCYQRLYNENAHYQRNFNNNNNNNNGNNNNDSTNINHNANNNNTNTNSSSNSNSSTSNHNNSNTNNSTNNNNHNSSNNNNNTNGRKSPFLGFICKTNGKSTSNSKEVICPDDKYKEEGDLWNVEAQTAFLGPNLWEKTLPYDADLKYADLDEFLSENNIPDGLPGTHLGHSSSLGHRSDSLSHAAGLSLGLGHITTKRERSPSPSDCISPDTLNPPSPAESTFSFASSGRDFDPRTRAFSDEELKPQPMIKKSRKQFVPDELKDDKYWARRRKNNIAAKRSRDARRQKENQIAMRARYLEKENATLHQEVEQLKQENMDLRARLSKFQDV